MQTEGPVPFLLIRFSCDVQSSSLPGTGRETALHMEISFVNINFHFKGVISLVFRVSTVYAVSRNNPYAKDTHFGVAYSTFHLAQKGSDFAA